MPETSRPKLIEIPPTDWNTKKFINKTNSYIRTYIYGECSVIVTKEYGAWHISVAHPSRYPSWDEILAVRYLIAPAGATMAMILPPKESYININENCFQMFELKTDDFKAPLPTAIRSLDRDYRG